MIYVIVGKSASGKSTFAKKLQEHGIERIRTYTTRPRRPGEDEKEYKFVTEEQFGLLDEMEFFLETVDYDANFGFCRYGSALKDYQTKKNKCIILTPKGIEKLRKHPEIKKTIIYLDYDRYTRLDRAIKRGDDRIEMIRRFDADDRDFEEFDKSHNWDFHVIDYDTRQQALNSICAWATRG